jgi:tetraacyldisaccharide-1-P 4'-kinase
MCFAFCGIARPENFFTELGKAGVRVVGTHSFGDHHAYRTGDVELLFKLAQQAGATEFVTTEKDAVNLAEHLAQLHPLHIVPLGMVVEEPTGPLTGAIVLSESVAEALREKLRT